MTINLLNPQTGTDALIAGAIIVGLFYLAVKLVNTHSPHGKLAKLFPTKEYPTLDETRRAQSSVTITLGDGDQGVFAGPTDNIYLIGRPEGVLLCGPWIGQIFRLNANFLIPWSRIGIYAERAESGILPGIKGFRYTATIQTDIGTFSMNLFDNVVGEGIKAGYFPHLQNKEAPG